MEVFLSWSGEKSRKAAEAFRDWLPSVIQALKPYFTPKDIDKGLRWSHDISGKLDNAQFGIILLTKNNLNAPWILFEAGALSKNVGSSRVCPILLDIKPTDLSGPLVQFQASQFEKNEIRRLLGALNDSLGESALNEKTLDVVFEKWWPDLEAAVAKAISETGPSSTAEVRSERDLLEEVLRLVRRKTYQSFESDNKLLERLARKPVSYDPALRAIKIWFHESGPYEIALEQLSSGSELMDFVLQLNSKGICKAEHIKAFLGCVEELTDRYFKKNAQGVFCPGGSNQQVEWPSD